MSDNLDLLKALREIEAERAKLEAQRDELLDVLEKVVEDYAVYYRGEPSSCLMAREIIAKAKGGQP